MAKKYYWTRKEEARLRDLCEKGIRDPEVLRKELKRPVGGIKKNLKRLGLGIDDEKQFVIYDNVELKIGPTDIALLTGDSESGNSVLLRRIQKDLGKESDF